MPGSPDEACLGYDDAGGDVGVRELGAGGVGRGEVDFFFGVDGELLIGGVLVVMTSR